ncbi:MAG: hypothetical protein AAF717_07610 [Bacteroidota bacterium]
MPANPKHLSSPGQRVLKVTAGIIGGFIVSILFHNAIGSLLENKGALIITTAYSAFLVWALLLALAFMFKNGWKAWGIYLLLILVFGTIIYFSKP